MNIFKLLYRVSVMVRVLIERLAKLTEIGVWRSRDIFVSILLLGIFTPICLSGFDQLLKLYYTRDSVSNIFGLKSGILLLLVISFLVGCLVCEAGIRYLNYRSKKNNKRGVATPFDRLLSTLPYIWVWFETTRMYQLQLVQHFRYKPEIIAKFYPLIATYDNFPGHKFGLISFTLFALFFYGIGRNKSRFRHIVRYHSIQALLVEALFYFQYHLYSLWTERRVSDDFLSEQVALMFYFFILFALIMFVLSAIFGRLTRFPFLHDAVLYHTGLEEDDQRWNNF